MAPEEERAHGTISGKTYFKFTKEGVKSYFGTVILLVFYISVEVCVHNVIVSVYGNCIS